MTEKTEETAATAGSDGADPQATAVEQLKEVRRLARLAETRDLQIKKYEYEQYKTEDRDFSQLKEKFSVKRLMYGAGAIVAVIVIVFVATTVYRITIPGRLLGQYEQALAEGNYSLADTHINNYFNYVPDDWERLVDHGQLLLHHGHFINARSTYARLLAKSPLANDKDILFLSAMSHLPKLRTTSNKMGEMLATFDDYIPALVAHAVLNTSDLEESLAEADSALDELSVLRADGETYGRYQELLNLFFVNMCRSVDAFPGTLAPPFEVYPARLRGNDLFLYGLDPNMSLNLCTAVPTGSNAADVFNPDIDSLSHATKALVSLRDGGEEDAIRAISQSLAKESFAFNSYLNGILLAMSGDMKRAETAFLRTGIETPEVLLALNIVKMLQGPDSWDDKAREPLDQVVKANPNSSQAYNNLAVLKMLDGRYGQAKNDLEFALSASKHNPYAIYNLAIVNMRTGDAERAIELLNSLLSLGESEETFPGLNFYLATASRNIGLEDRAINLLRNSVNEPGYGTLANVALGDIYSRERIGAEVAQEFYQRAFDLDNNNYEASIKLALTKAKLGTPDEALIEIGNIEDNYTPRDDQDSQYFTELLNAAKGEILFHAGDPEARAVLMQAFEQTKDLGLYKRVVELYVDALIAEGVVREALDVTRTALPSDPQDPVLLITRAKALAAFNDLAEALEIINDAERKSPDDPVMLATKANILIKDQRWIEAVETYRRLYDRNPNDLAPLEDAVALLERVGGYPELLEEMEELLGKAQFSPEESLAAAAGGDAQVTDPAQVEKIEAEIEELGTLIEQGTVDKFSGYLYRGFLMTRIGRIPDSIDEFLLSADNVDEKPEEGYKAWQALSNSYILTAQFEAALDALNRALEMDPPEKERNTMLVTLAGVKERLGRLDDALADYGKIIESLPNYTLPYMRRGVILLSFNEAEQAIENLSFVIKLEPANIDAYRSRQKAFNMLGDSESAAKDAKSILLLENR